MSQFAWTFQGGIPKQEVTSITLVNNVAFTEDVTVPAGKQWLLTNIKIINPDDVTRNISITIYKEAAKTNVLFLLLSAVAFTATSLRNLPSAIPAALSPSHNLIPPIELVAGNVINILWAAGGASTGATDADALVICYKEIDTP